VFKGVVCIDYRPQQSIDGLNVVFAGTGEYKPAYTRSLYSNFFERQIARAGLVRRIPYAPFDEPLASGELRSAVGDLHNYLAGGYALDSLNPLRENTAYKGNRVPTAERARYSMLGGPMPIKLSKAGATVAPLLHRYGVHAEVTVSHPSSMTTDVMADRLGRQHARNVIGVSMQKIPRGKQGDIMLHDGV
jgi:hypothetical protein